MGLYQSRKYQFNDGDIKNMKLLGFLQDNAIVLFRPKKMKQNIPELLSSCCPLPPPLFFSWFILFYSDLPLENSNFFSWFAQQHLSECWSSILEWIVWTSNSLKWCQYVSRASQTIPRQSLRYCIHQRSFPIGSLDMVTIFEEKRIYQMDSIWATSLDFRSRRWCPSSSIYSYRCSLSMWSNLKLGRLPFFPAMGQAQFPYPTETLFVYVCGDASCIVAFQWWRIDPHL